MFKSEDTANCFFTVNDVPDTVNRTLMQSQLCTFIYTIFNMDLKFVNLKLKL